MTNIYSLDYENNNQPYIKVRDSKVYVQISELKGLTLESNKRFLLQTDGSGGLGAVYINEDNIVIGPQGVPGRSTAALKVLIGNGGVFNYEQFAEDVDIDIYLSTILANYPEYSDETYPSGLDLIFTTKTPTLNKPVRVIFDITAGLNSGNIKITNLTDYNIYFYFPSTYIYQGEELIRRIHCMDTAILQSTRSTKYLKKYTSAEVILLEQNYFINTHLDYFVS